MARKRSNDAPTSIGNLLARTAPGRAAQTVVLSRGLWEEVAGVGFARRTRPDRIDRGTLHVIVASSGWAQELTLHAPTILERLKARGIDVERMRFKVGDVEAPEHGGVLVPGKDELERARNASPSREAIAPLSKVAGPALRDAIEGAARAAARRDAETRAVARAAAQKKPRVPGNSR